MKQTEQLLWVELIVGVVGHSVVGPCIEPELQDGSRLAVALCLKLGACVPLARLQYNHVDRDNNNKPAGSETAKPRGGSCKNAHTP